MLAKLQDCYMPHIRILKIWTKNVNEIGAIIMAWFLNKWKFWHGLCTHETIQVKHSDRDVKENDIEIK